MEETLFGSTNQGGFKEMYPNAILTELNYK
jgi:hypothetical protein